MEKQKRFWNEYYETMSREELKDLQLKRFKEIFTYAYENSPAYRELYDEKGVKPEDVQTYEDFQKVPLVDKKFFSKAIDDTLYGKTLSVPEKDIVFYHQTSGTTSTAVKWGDSLTDWYWNAECWANNLWSQGVNPSDRVMVAFNYNLFIGFWSAHYGCEKLGVEIIPSGGLTSEQKLQKIQELKVNILIITPTYAFRLAEVAKELGMDAAELGIEKIICAGEPGASIPSVKEKMEQLWNCDVYDHIGTTETGSWAFECAQKPGGPHVNEAMFLVEIMDFETNEIITEPNKYGRVIVTTFNRKSSPCVRFNTNDIACWSDKKCRCGRTSRLVKGGVQGRMDHILKVRGTFVNPVVLEDIVMREPRLSRDYIIEISKDGQVIELHVEAAPEVEESAYQEVTASVKKTIYNATFLNIKVSLVPFGTLPRNELKAKKVIDHRKDGKDGRKIFNA